MGNEILISVKDFILNFTNEFSDSFLYAYILQIILIAYMYSCAGSGRYWKIMLAGSIFGMYAAITEHIGTAWLKTVEESKGSIKGSKGLYCYFFAEIGWIATEFSIPYLNLIKLNTLSQGRIIRTVNHIVAILFSFFAAFRLYIGYLRVTHGQLYDDAIYSAHGIAFGITALADGLLSTLIFHHLNKNAEQTREKDGETFNLLASFKKSSLFILFVVDLMSVILAIISIFTGIPTLRDSLSKLMKPFHALKSNFILVLAIDAFIFKMRATVDGTTLVSRFLQRQSKMRSITQAIYNDNDPLFNKRNRNNRNSHMRSKHNSQMRSRHNSQVRSMNNSQLRSVDNLNLDLSPLRSMDNSPLRSIDNSQLLSLNNSTINLSAMNNMNNSFTNTPTQNLQKKYKSALKKNYEGIDSPSYSINLGSLNMGSSNMGSVTTGSANMGMVNNMMVDVYGVEKRGTAKQGAEKYSPSTNSTSSDNSQTNLKKKTGSSSNRNNLPVPQNPIIISPMTPLNPSYNSYLKTPYGNGNLNYSNESLILNSSNLSLNPNSSNLSLNPNNSALNLNPNSSAMGLNLNNSAMSLNPNNSSMSLNPNNSNLSIHQNDLTNDEVQNTSINYEHQNYKNKPKKFSTRFN